MTTIEILKIIDTALMAIIEMNDSDSWVEQVDCIEPLCRLRDKLKDKEAPTNDGTENT